jgi:hypothetical protein
MTKLPILLSLLVVPVACGTPASGGKTQVADSTVVSDAADSGPLFGKDATPTTDSGGDTTPAGKGVWLTFAVDDSANQTFGNADIKWTGSFKWDAKTNSIEPATSWLPTDGPYPVLYDDGPFASGGHEQDDGVAGDHILTTKVLFTPSADTTLEYGALNELDHWMWVGPNGQIAVPKTASGTIAVPGMKLKKFGTHDAKLTLDLAALNPAFKTWNATDFKFFVKGTMNQWTPVQLLDDGQKGDAKAGDGVLTYVHSQHLIKHVGLIPGNEEVQFTFVATQGDQEPEDGQEYKAATQAYTEGVAAFSDDGADKSWTPLPVVLAKDSKGKFLNSAFQVPEMSSPACTPACGQGESCQGGQCVKDVPTGCVPACASDETCVPQACSPGAPCASVCVKNAPVLAIAAVEPSKGWTTGGQVVTVTGSGIASGASVTLGGTAGTEVVVAADGKSLTTKTPAHDSGLVDVEVKNPDGKVATLTGGFYFQVLPKPTIVITGAATINGNDKDPLSFSAVAKVVGVTQDVGASPGLQVAIGYGPAGTEPLKDAAKWLWVDAQFTSEDAGKAEETWTAKLPMLAIGQYVVAARATWSGQTEYGDTDGSENGVQAAKLVAVTISAKSTAPTLTAVTPGYAAAKGGTTLVLQGENLGAGTTVQFVSSFKGKTADAQSVKVVAGGLQVVTPAMPPLPADVVVTPPGGTALKLLNALDIVPLDTPVVDGTIGVDWSPFSLAALGTTPTAWGAGKNELQNLYISYDAKDLYLGIGGAVESANAIVVYFDVDYGAGTGVQNPVDLKDNSGAVDDAVAGVLKVLDTKIGLDFALATVGMASFDGVDLAQSTGAGWRNLSNASDFSWLNGAIKTTATQLEATIPLATLYPAGIPATGMTLKYAVVLVNKDGSAVSNQFLPGQDGAPDATTLVNWGTFHVYPVAP